MNNENEKNNSEFEKISSENCILHVNTGSRAYGTHHETSDFDSRGIYVGLINNIVILENKVDSVQFSGEDKMFYELSKYVELLKAQNPNIIELLWVEDKDIRYKNELGQLLIDNRDKFLTKKTKDTYIGYALSQLNRIKGHNKWINNPQSLESPKQKDYISVIWNYTNNKEFNNKAPAHGYLAVSLGANQYALWNKDKLQKFNLKSDSWIDKQGKPSVMETGILQKLKDLKLDPDLIVKINFNLYEENFNNWKGYHDWKKNRNEKRAKLEEKYGYDVKHASHLIRLLNTGLEILEEKIVRVARPDKQLLIDILNGQYKYEELISMSDKILDKIDIAYKKSKLPESIDKKFIDNMVLGIYTQKWGINNTNKILSSQYKLNF